MQLSVVHYIACYLTPACIFQMSVVRERQRTCIALRCSGTHSTQEHDVSVIPDDDVTCVYRVARSMHCY